MNLLFLDIDGVLNSGKDHDLHEAWWNSFGWRFNSLFVYGNKSGDYMRKKKLKVFEEIVETHDFTLIGVSSWFSTQYTHQDFSQLTGLHMEDVTDYTGGGIQRGEAVQRYMNKHNPNKVIILDDSWLQVYNPEQQQKYCVRIDSQVGLQQYHLEEVGYLLSKQ